MSDSNNPASRPPLLQARLTVDIVVLTIADNDLKVLTVRRQAEPYKHMLTLPGGFMWEGETTAHSVARLLKDKAGVGNVYVEQLYTFDNLDRDSRDRVITLAYIALVPEHKLARLAPHAQLTAVKGIEQLGFDHNRIVDYAVGRARSKLEYTNAAYSLLPNKFTLSDLQNVYEIVLGYPLDKRNFRKKILSLDMVKETTEMQSGKKHRPARLFTFKKHTVEDFPSPFVFSKSA